MNKRQKAIDDELLGPAPDLFHKLFSALVGKQGAVIVSIRPHDHMMNCAGLYQHFNLSCDDDS